MKVSVIGAGAAGCFCAIHIKRMAPQAQVTVFEAGQKPLAKVAITGGGRCNLTNTFLGIRSLKEAYPRGEQVVKRAFCEFDHLALQQWFEHEGVALVTQPDQCIFPQSQDAMQIVHTLLRLMEQEGVRLVTGSRVSLIEAEGSGYKISFAGGQSVVSDCVVVTTGGSPKLTGLDFLSPLSLTIEQPVPSLFSFNISGTSPLMGTVVDKVTCGLCGTKLRTRGALLFTHWGMSGPAILKLSSHAARLLSESCYRAQLMVCWLDQTSEAEAAAQLAQMQSAQPSKQIGNTHLPQTTSRLWQYLLQRADIRPEQRWAEVGQKQLRKLVTVLTADIYQIEGQSRHKEEFVTCGGVSLKNINPSTLECRTHPGLYFAGEVLDVDAITGGFNLQAAWSMGFVAAKGVAARCQ